jgi:hypothetical protein
MRALTRADVVKKVRQQPGFTLGPCCPICQEIYEAKYHDAHVAACRDAKPPEDKSEGSREGRHGGLVPAA